MPSSSPISDSPLSAARNLHRQFRVGVYALASSHRAPKLPLVEAGSLRAIVARRVVDSGRHARLEEATRGDCHQPCRGKIVDEHGGSDLRIVEQYEEAGEFRISLALAGSWRVAAKGD